MPRSCFPRRVRHPLRLLQGTLAAASLCAGGALAAPIVDPANDFIASFTGPKNAELDVLRADFSYDGTSFHFSSTEAGPISTTSGALFVWGVDRGAGTARFGAIAPGVLFDSVIVVNPTAGTATVNRLVGGGSTVLTAGAFQVLGSTLLLDVPAVLLPSQGFAPTAYTANLWPRSGAGGNEVISDFAPNNSNITVAVVPEPATLALVASALAAMAVRRRSAGVPTPP